MLAINNECPLGTNQPSLGMAARKAPANRAASSGISQPWASALARLSSAFMYAKPYAVCALPPLTREGE